MRITIVTINTWKCDGEYPKRLKVLVNELLRNKFDILCCQEVFSSSTENLNTERYLKNNLKLDSFYFPSREKVRFINNHNRMSFSGLAILTNLNVSQSKEIFLPSDILDGERTAQCLTLYKGNKKIAIINTHLTHLRNASALRVEQIKNILSSFDNINCDILLLCGDLNTTPDSEVIEIITDDYLFKPIFKNYPNTRNGKCIDYIFYKSKEHISVYEAKTIFDSPSSEGVYASDHFGISATFEF